MYLVVARRCPAEAKYSFCKQPAIEFVEEYLNLGWLKTEVGLPSDYHFRDINTEIWQAFHDCGTWYSPTTKELIDILDAHTEDVNVGDIKLLILNSNLDFMVNTPRTLWQYEQLRWRGQPDYQSRQFQPLPDGLAATESWKATGNGRLAFVAIDDDGHFMSDSAREGYSRIVDKWLQGGWQMGDGA